MPDWVRALSLDGIGPGAATNRSEGVEYLLYEQQENPAAQESFTHVAVLMHNESGVQDSGSLTFSFNPSYEELALHRIQIHRGTNALDRLDRSKIRVVQPESGLANHVYTGDHRAVVVVEDLRVGDVLEYAHTTRGVNPALAGHFARQFTVQSGVAIGQQRFRVLWSSPGRLYRRQYLDETTPALQSRNGVQEYVWDFGPLPAIRIEDHLPDGFEPYPYIELTDFDTWERVVEWALPLYAFGSELAAPLRDLISSWEATASTPEGRVQQALRFVQDEVRYTAIALGTASLRPAPPVDTLQRRFGDCKDKAYLFCTLARALGVEAYPALVDTSLRAGVERRLPSPRAFNHVIAQVRLGDAVVWVDPTRSHQRGGIREGFLPRYGKALVVRPGTSDLEPVTAPPRRDVDVGVVSTFTVRDYESPVALRVETAFRGGEADDLRERLARTDPASLGEDYLNFYARYYEGIRATRPLEVRDDEARNVLTLVEHYEIAKFWQLNEAGTHWEASLYADNLETVLPDPTARVRKMPLGIPYPLRRQQELIVRLPDDDWRIEPLSKSVEHEAFRFDFRREFGAGTARFHYACETRCPEVPPDGVGDYLGRLSEVDALLGDTLSRPIRGSELTLSHVNWLMVALAGFSLAAVTAGALWFLRVTRTPASLPPPLVSDSGLRGLRGWLILVGIGLVLTPLAQLSFQVRHWESYFSAVVWQQVAMPQGESYHVLYGPVLIVELIGNVAFLGVSVLLIHLFFARRRWFPRLFIAARVAHVAFLLGDQALASLLPGLARGSDTDGWTQIVRSVAASLIWIAYMVRSRRVKATFVR